MAMSYKELIDRIKLFAESNPDVLNQSISILVTHEDEVYPVNDVFIVEDTCEHCMNSMGLGSLDIDSLVIETKI